MRLPEAGRRVTTLADEVRRWVDRCVPLLPGGELAEVRHYLEHDEHEMAFEGLILEMIRHEVTLPVGWASDWLGLAERLGLRDHSVFVGDLWPRLQAWCDGSESAVGDGIS